MSRRNVATVILEEVTPDATAIDRETTRDGNPDKSIAIFLALVFIEDAKNDTNGASYQAE